MEEVNHSFYGKINIFTNDDAICIWVKKGIIWEEYLVDAIFKYYKKGDMVDVGAYIGLHTIAMSKLSKVYAFECQPLSYHLLKDNVKHLENVETNMVALSDKEGQRYIDLIDIKSVSNFGGFGSRGTKNDGEREIGCPSATLDSYHLNDIGLIKIDVEGHELKVLKGAEQTIKNSQPVLIVEILGGVDYDNTTEDNKRTIDKVKNYICENFNYVLVERISMHDYIFIPKTKS